MSDNYSDFFTIVNLAESDKEDLIADLAAIVSSFTARELVLERITVNYIRDNLTEYETHLKEVAGQAGRVVRRRVYDEIAAQYPEYAEE